MSDTDFNDSPATDVELARAILATTGDPETASLEDWQDALNDAAKVSA